MPQRNIMTAILTRKEIAHAREIRARIRLGIYGPASTKEARNVSR